MVRPIDLARQWHEEGLISKTSMAKLERRYADGTGPEIGPDPSDGGFSRVFITLIGGAAWVLAAAVVAGPAIAGAEPMTFGVVGIIASALAAFAALAMWRTTDHREYAEALGVSSIILLVVAGTAFAAEGLEAFAFIGAVALLALPWIPQITGLVATHGAIGSVLLWIIGFSFLDRPEAAVNTGLLVAAALTMAMLMTERQWPGDGRWRLGDASFFMALATIILSAAFAIVTLELEESVAVELFVGAFTIVAILAGYYLASRPVVLAGVLGLSVVAVVFGFDIGVYAGIPMLLLVASGLVALAMWSQRRGGLPVAHRSVSDQER